MKSTISFMFFQHFHKHMFSHLELDIDVDVNIAEFLVIVFSLHAFLQYIKDHCVCIIHTVLHVSASNLKSYSQLVTLLEKVDISLLYAARHIPNAIVLVFKAEELLEFMCSYDRTGCSNQMAHLLCTVRKC